jgi:hypothetical protein
MVEKGADGHLNLTLEGVPLRVGVRVQRVGAAEGSAGYRLGATFVALTPDHRQLIKQFMAK